MCTHRENGVCYNHGVCNLINHALARTHSPPSGPVEPALHTHAVSAALPAGEAELSGHDAHVASAVAPASAEYLPASQSVHSALPVPALNLPAAQSTHWPPSGPVEPALHTHAAATVLAAGEAELSGHDAHVASAVAPASAEYLSRSFSRSLSRSLSLSLSLSPPYTRL